MHDVVALERKSVVKIDEQFSLLKKFGLPETSAERYWVEESAFPDGRPQYILRKRDMPITIYDDGVDKRTVTRLSKTVSERMGGMKINVERMSPGAARSVVDNVLCQSIEVGEVDGFGEI